MTEEINNEITFVGNENHFNNIKRMIPDIGWLEVTYDGGVYVGGEFPFLVKQQNFVYKNGESGSFCIVTDVNAMVLRLKSAATVVIFGSIMTIVFTAGILVAWLYQGILKPLNALRRATRQMQEGF